MPEAGLASLQPLAHERDVLPQGVEQRSEGDWYAEAAAPLIQVVQPSEQIAGALCPNLGGPGLILDQLQLAVKPEHPAPHGPAVGRGYELQHRIQHREQRDEHDEQLLREYRQPEWQVTLQKRPSCLVKLYCLVGQREVY